jgi:LacI family transcriptional regulator
MASITEVAKLAGVSTATASRVVGEVDYPVSETTRERVLAAARQLDYVPNALARGLLKSTVPIVGVIVHDITDPYFNEVVRGVEDAANDAGYLVITCSSDLDPARQNSYARLLRSLRAGAVIFAGSGIADGEAQAELVRHVAGIRANGSAVVHLSAHAGGPPDVGVDNVGGIAAIVAALVELGHTRIAFLAGPETLLVARDRLAGYERGMAAADLDIDARLIVNGGFDRAGGAAGVDELMARGVEFSAIACANDLLALGALQRLAELGRKVPRDVSVAGFDDISVAALTAPHLSTVRLPLREMGRRGFNAAMRMLNGEAVAPETLATEVVLRDSTARRER